MRNEDFDAAKKLKLDIQERNECAIDEVCKFIGSSGSAVLEAATGATSPKKKSPNKVADSPMAVQEEEIQASTEPQTTPVKQTQKDEESAEKLAAEVEDLKPGGDAS